MIAGPALWVLSYALLYWFALFAFVWIHSLSGRRLPEHSGRVDRGDVLVLVPSHHEGEGLVDTVRTLIDQDYEGFLEVQVLVQDFTDETVDALATAYGTASRSSKVLTLDIGLPQRLASVVAVGDNAKHAKLNHALGHATADFIALLDADHRASLDWVSNGVSVLIAERADAVQFRKRALSSGGLPKTWDSGLSHLTFELFNRALQFSFGGVSFTGSTAVFRAGPLKKHLFSDCITEDTFLSYSLMLSGHRIVYDARTGSFEEVTPNIPSFVFRRRRWSAGHTHAFLHHLPRVFRASAPIESKILVLFNGQFFLIPALIALFFMVHGGYYFALFPVEMRALVLLVSGFGAAALSLWLSRRRTTKINDFLVAWLVLFPQACIGGTALADLVLGERYLYLTAFPFERYVWLAEFLFFVTGIVTFVLAGVRIGGGTLGGRLTFILSFPFLVFFDLLSAVFGLSDFLLSRRQWSVIDRTQAYSDDVDDALKERLVVTRRAEPKTQRRVGVPVMVLLGMTGLAAVNEVLSVGPCGQVQPFLWEPFTAPEAPAARLSVGPIQPSGDGEVEAVVTVQVDSSDWESVSITLYDGDARLTRGESADEGDGTLTHVLRWPMGWDVRTVRASVVAPGMSCVLENDVSTRHITVGANGVVVNGEPFTIKGMVASFLVPSIDLDVDSGFQQLKSVGVNTVRLYHPPTPQILQAARDHSMLLIPQPDQSTWDNFDPQSPLSRSAYRGRWDKLAAQSVDEPHVLLLNGGNELEIKDRGRKQVSAIRAILSEMSASTSIPTTYSTFATFIDYPVDILGINMLDSGPTYWDGALAMVRGFGTPFYASEFGGFVAFFERPSSALRQWRMAAQVEALERYGASGMVYFSSHDNWSQPVPPGEFNDPFSGDHPDDRRGFWDQDNTPKPELEMLKHLLADVTVRLEPLEGDALRILVQNRRKYTLEGVVMGWGGEDSVEVGTIPPHASVETTVDRSMVGRHHGVPDVELRFDYTTHRGLRASSIVPVQVPLPDAVTIADSPVFRVQREDERLSFSSILGGTATVHAPLDWASVSVGSSLVPMVEGRASVDLPSPMWPVLDLEMSRDGKDWRGFDAAEVGAGEVFLRFTLPDVQSEEVTLVLAGLAAQRVHFKWSDEMESVDAHPYRETLVNAAGRSGRVTLRMDRRRPRYLSATRSPTGEPVDITLSEPMIFAPQRVEVRRGE